ncbi:putative ankyrin repeat protein [Diplonema papillatum]|nr:putative ankyrin repeat protein [Diplonema papillatum]
MQLALSAPEAGIYEFIDVAEYDTVGSIAEKAALVVGSLQDGVEFECDGEEWDLKDTTKSVSDLALLSTSVLTVRLDIKMRCALPRMQYLRSCGIAGGRATHIKDMCRAVRANNIDVVKALLSVGTPIVVEHAAEGEDPLHAACRDGNSQMVQVLLAHAQGDEAPAFDQINVKNFAGLTAFSCLAQAPCSEEIIHIAKLLVAHGASGVIDDGLGANDVIEQAVRHRRYTLARFLANGLAGHDVAIAPRQCGTTPLLKLCQSPFSQELMGRKVFRHLVRQCRKHHVNPMAPHCKTQSTPLHLAAAWKTGSLFVKLVLQKGAKLDSRDSLGRTPLFVACQHASLKTVSTLLSRGADPNAIDHQSITPFQAVAQADPECSDDTRRALHRKLLSAGGRRYFDSSNVSTAALRLRYFFGC